MAEASKIEQEIKSDLSEIKEILRQNFIKSTQAYKAFCESLARGTSFDVVEMDSLLFDGSDCEVVYFLKSKQTKLIKIGTTKNLKTRMMTIESAGGHDLDVLLLLRGYFDIEKTLHEKFASSRVKGEWFQASPKILEFVKKAKEQISTAHSVSRILSKLKEAEV